MKKRKILIDLTRLKNLYTGFGQLSLNVAEHIQANYNAKTSTIEITLLVPKDFIGKFGNEVNYISSSNFFRRHFQFLFPRFDVWHTLDQLCHYKPIFSKATKSILTVHDLNYLYETTGASKQRKHKRLLKKIRRTDQIVCISEFAKSELEKNFDLRGKPCKVIHNGVIQLNKDEAVQPSFISTNKLFLFTIGVISRKKNFHVLLDLMKLYPNLHLYIAGKEDNSPTNNYGEFMRSKINEDGISNVTLTGTISHNEKIWFYKHCEAFLFPSLFEGFGLPIIEAMQFGKPVISSKETSLGEIGGQYAFYMDSFEPERIKEVLENGLQKIKSDNSFVKNEIEYANSFSFENYYNSYEKLYETV